MIGYTIDVSHHQDPGALPWESFRGHVDAVIVRASFGTVLDNRAKEHARCAREIGAKVGLYTFFRPSQDWRDQMQALRSVAESVKLTGGDVVPALDIEDDPIAAANVSPAWSAACEAFTGQIATEFGNCIAYISKRGWSMLGKPEWVLHLPLWVADWRVGATVPYSPGNMPATLWQHRVGPFQPNGAGGYDKAHPVLDQSRILQPLPLVGYRPSSEDQERVRAQVFETLRRGVQDSDTDPSELEPPEEFPLS